MNGSGVMQRTRDILEDRETKIRRTPGNGQERQSHAFTLTIDNCLHTLIMQRHLVQSTSRAILPCSSPFASTSSARPFSSTPSTHAKLKAERLQKGNDPMDMANLQDFKYDDVPYQSHLNLEKDREKLHLLRLMKFQLPEMQSE